MKAAIYIRVSTDKQDYNNQIGSLKDYCNKKGIEIKEIYKEIISGKESNRPEFKRMLEDASKRKFDAILVWALDRFTREGVDMVWKYIKQLDYYGVEFISYQEPFLNTDNKMVKDMLFSIMGILAEQERLKLVDRTKARLNMYKDQIEKKGYAITKEGKKITRLGRPEVSNEIKDRILELRKEGKTIDNICKEVYYWTSSNSRKYVSKGFVHKTIKESSL